MKRSSFVTLILGVIGGVLFALGMCMTLLPEWGLRTQGIIAGVIGIVLLIITLVHWRKTSGKPLAKPSKKTVLAVLVGVVGALLFGVGMCMCLVFANYVLGIILGVVGIVIMLLLIPLTKGLHD